MKNKSENKLSEITRMELKYCEYCGSLWLRRESETQVYCPECLPQIEQLPRPTRQVHHSRLPLGPRPVSETELEFDEGFEVEVEDADLNFDDDEFGPEDFDATGFDAGGVA